MKKTQVGFTLIEVLTVMILIGILAVTAISKFSGSDSFEAYTYRTSLISDLRLTQQRAMQQTDNNHCHQIVFDTNRYGIPDRTDCGVVNFPNGWQPDYTSVDLNGTRYTVTFSIDGAGNIVSFDSMGRPQANCAGGCKINVASTSSGESVQIQIESEGYIHGI